MIRLTKPQFTEKEVQAVRDVLFSGLLVQGQKVSAFELALEQFVGASKAVCVSSGTAALHLSLAGLGVAKGDAVFVPAFTFPAVANIVEIQGARPVFIDVNPSTYCMEPALLAAAIMNWPGPEKPSALIVVHEFGAPCALSELTNVALKAGLTVIEDAACAAGAYYCGRHVGTFGKAGCFSWHPRKAITTGEGGAVVTDDSALHERVALLRNHGARPGRSGSVDFLLPGLNYRMTEIQAAIGIIQLEKLGAYLSARKRLVSLYRHAFANVPDLRLPLDVPGHAWQTFMVVLPRRASRTEIIARLRDKGIETGPGAYALPALTYYQSRYGCDRGDWPVSDELHDKGLALPLYASMSESEVEYVATALGEALAC